MKGNLRLMVSGFLFVFGFAILVVFNWYIKPNFFAQEVVRLKSDVPKFTVLTEKDLMISRVSEDALPAHAVTDPKQIIGKKTNVDLPSGIVLTTELLDIEGVNPAAGEAIFPIRKEDIYAVNGSLRALDHVDIYLIETEQKRKEREANADDAIKADSGLQTSAESEQTAENALQNGHADTGTDLTSALLPPGEPVLRKVKVVAARTDSGNMVRDSEDGNTNDRLTATDRISHVELLLQDENVAKLKAYIESGYQLWLVRVS